MRFFLMACMFCLLIASVGCMTNNWSSPLFQRNGMTLERVFDDDVVDVEKPKTNFWTTKFGESSGLDPRAQAVEARLGL